MAKKTTKRNIVRSRAGARPLYGEPMRMITIRCPAFLIEALDELALAEGISRDARIRRVLADEAKTAKKRLASVKEE